MTIEEMRSNAEKLKELNKNLDEAVAELEVSIFCVSYEVGCSVTGWKMLFGALGAHCQAGLMIPKFRNVWLLSSYPTVWLLSWKMCFGEEKYWLKSFKWNNCNCKQSAAAGCCPWETVLRTEVAGGCWGDRCSFSWVVLLELCTSLSAYSLIKTKCFPAPCIISRTANGY